MRSLSNIITETEESQFENAVLPDLVFAINLPESEEVKEQKRIKKEKEDILQKALKQAEQILAQAKEEANKIREEAYEEGYIKGAEEGTKEGRKRAYQEYKEELAQILEKVLDDVEGCAKDIDHAKQKVLEEHLDDLKDISLAIGEKIVQTSLRSSTDIVKNMITAATSKLKKTAWAKIYISMKDENKAREIQGDAEFLTQLSRIAENVKVIVMEKAQEGTCIIELPNEVMDISVGTQMENITEILNNARA